MLKKNDIVDLVITDYDYDGYGIAHLFDYTIFVKEALVGEEIKTLILKVSNNNICFGKIVDIIKKSPERIEPLCPYYHLCGGCNLAHMSYQEELRLKESSFKNTIKKMVKDVKINPIIKADDIYYYRNKISLPIGYDNDYIVGFYQERTHNIIPSSTCLIENKYAREVVFSLLDEFRKYNLSVYSDNNESGLLRHLILRSNLEDKFMLTIVSTKENKDLIDLLASFDNKRVVSIYLNINDKHNNVILGDKYLYIKGQKTLDIVLNGTKFMLHPNSFFQVNYHQMQKLYAKAISLLDPKKEEVLIDAYSGIGSIALSIANSVKKVYGIEIVKEAVDNAKENAKINNISNVEFICGACEEEIDKLVSKVKIDAVIMDPPRKGSDYRFLDCLINNRIPKIIYISCSPKTLARDLKYLCENGYNIASITPVDMFSMTSNVETVCSLVKK